MDGWDWIGLDWIGLDGWILLRTLVQLEHLAVLIMGGQDSPKNDDVIYEQPLMENTLLLLWKSSSILSDLYLEVGRIPQ